MVASAALVVLALWAAWELPDRRLLRRLRSFSDAERARSGRVRPPGWLVAVAGGAAIGCLPGGPGIAVGLAVGILAGAAAALGARGRRRRRASLGRQAVARAGEVLAQTIRVGAIPASALAIVAVEHDVLAEAGALQAVGGDVVPALRRAAAGPGRAGLSDLAAAWEVASRTGASLCDSIEAVAAELARREEAAATVRVELASMRAAAKLLAVLPLAGIGIGYALGGSPLQFLTSGLAGQVCLVVAAMLCATGLLWTDALAERAAR